jgi:hypothetical protein
MDTLFAQELEGSKTVAEAHKDEDELPPGLSASGDEEKPESRPRGRRPLSSELKRERIEHDLAEAGKHCASCNQDLRPIGEETSERYEYVPRSCG